MKTIRLRPLKEILASQLPKMTYQWSGKNFQIFLIYLSHLRGATIFGLILFGFLSFWSRQSLILFLLLALIVGLSYYFISQVARFIEAEILFVPNVAFEKQTSKVGLLIKNQSTWSIPRFMVSLIYLGTKNVELNKAFLKGLTSGDSLKFEIEWVNDMGMGLFDLGPLLIYVQDPLGIFQFEVQFDLFQKIEVFPFVENIHNISTQGSLQSQIYGLHEVRTRGFSVNLSGVRPYNSGDSIRHIAWRPTARLNQLIVKDFERVVNSEVTLIANLNPAVHLGSGPMNTWELVKDISLSILSQMIELGNSIQFGDNKAFVERGYGAEVFTSVSKRLMEYDIFKESDRAHESDFYTAYPLKTWITQVPQGSTLIYVTVLNYKDLELAIIEIKAAVDLQIEVVLVLINPTSFIPVFESAHANLEIPNERSLLQEILRDLKNRGVQVYFSDLGKSLKDGFKPYQNENETR